MGFFDKILGSSEPNTPQPLNVSDDVVVSPVNGNVIDIKTVSDSLFSDELMGKTCAIKVPEDTAYVCSPANGSIKALFPTGHAFGIELNNGCEILVHIGIDTVNAKGKGFDILAEKGMKVKAGQPIVKVNFKELKKKYSMPVMVIVTKNINDMINFITLQEVKIGDQLNK